MDDKKQEIIEKLKTFNNILVTVSRNPSVDQLAACIGLTLLLNKLDKHATAVFSGEIPNTIDFLKPEDTIEKNTNSLRDFIIALDKSKADKLRYKVEDKVVKIFITPYRTSLSEEDLNFSQGDFNIDVVMALGVHEQTELDEAITAHGRILHDATVVAINNNQAGELGTINWVKPDASSLSELVVELAKDLDKSLLDAQISTALLTGIVAETDRFRNEKTTATTMSLSADLMKAGANQQLVAEELDHEINVHAAEKPADDQPKAAQKPAAAEKQDKPDDGTLEIDHEIESVKETKQSPVLEEEAGEPEPEDAPTLPEPEKFSEPDDKPTESRSLITEEPTLGGRLTANTTAEEKLESNAVDPAILDPGVDKSQPLLSHDGPSSKAPTIQPLKHDDKPPKFPEPPKPAPQAIPVPTPTPHFEPPKSTIPPAPKPVPKPVPEPVTSSPVRPAPAPTPPPPPSPAPTPPPMPPKPPTPPKPETLTEREEPPAATPAGPDVDEVEKARQEVLKAISEAGNEPLPPVQALNAQPLGEKLHDEPPVPGGGQLVEPPVPPAPPAPTHEPGPQTHAPADQALTMPLPPSISVPPPQVTPPTSAGNASPLGPPPTNPPPVMPPSWPPKQ